MDGKPKVLLAGHSYIRRLAEYLPPRQFVGGSCDIIWKYQGGCTISGRYPYIASIDQVLSRHGDFDFAILQLGNNDIPIFNGQSNLKQLVNRYVQQVRDLCFKHDIKAVLCSEVPRGYNGSLDNTSNFNSILEERVSMESHISYWRHEGLHKANDTVQLPDRVHLNSKGQAKFFHSVQKAMTRQIKRT